MLELSVGLESFIKRWKGEILPFVQNGGAELKFIEGPYGRGKTHCLLAMQAAAAEMGFATCLVDCGMEQPPFASLAETYRAIARNLTSPGHESRGLAAVLKTASDDDLRALHEKSREHLAFANLCSEYAKRAKAGPLQQELAGNLRASADARHRMACHFSRVVSHDWHSAASGQDWKTQCRVMAPFVAPLTKASGLRRTSGAFR